MKWPVESAGPLGSQHPARPSFLVLHREVKFHTHCRDCKRTERRKEGIRNRNQKRRTECRMQKVPFSLSRTLLMTVSACLLVASGRSAAPAFSALRFKCSAALMGVKLWIIHSNTVAKVTWRSGIEGTKNILSEARCSLCGFSLPSSRIVLLYYIYVTLGLEWINRILFYNILLSNQL